MFTVEQIKASHIKVKSGADFPSFIAMCAKLGIEKWVVCMDKMTCTYYDKAGIEILVEQIPQ